MIENQETQEEILANFQVRIFKEIFQKMSKLLCICVVN